MEDKPRPAASSLALLIRFPDESLLKELSIPAVARARKRCNVNDEIDELNDVTKHPCC